MAQSLAAIGGVTFLLTFLHFVVDWGLQTHTEAMTKASDWKVRARHCCVYAVGLTLPLLFVLPDTGDRIFMLLLLWLSHFAIDTYIPVYIWAKYLRRAPQLQNAPSELEGFKALAKEPLGLFLVITMDQAWHILFLFPIASLIVFPEFRSWIYWTSSNMMAFLGFLVLLGKKPLTKDSSARP
jgi:hypothetical protein